MEMGSVSETVESVLTPLQGPVSTATSEIKLLYLTGGFCSPQANGPQDKGEVDSVFTLLVLGTHHVVKVDGTWPDV